MIGIPYRYLTADIPGLGGRIKDALDDFIVEEVPLYQPSGEGEHVYFLVEKSDLSTFEALEQFSLALDRPAHDFGYAGLKDRKGITRQVFSLSGVHPDRILALTHPRFHIVWARRHRNKLRVGHLRGNRFRLRVRGVEPDRDRVAAIIDRIASSGMPNYFGPQRFGVRGESPWIGRALILGDDRDAVRRILGNPSPFENNPDIVRARYRFEQYLWGEARALFPRTCREERRLLDSLIRKGEDWRAATRQLRSSGLKLYASSFQAWLFNAILEERLIETADPSRFVDGDVAYLHRNGALFAVERVDATIETRARAFEISPSGPVFGPEMLKPAGEPAMAESRALEVGGVSESQFDRLRSRCGLAGGRRPYRVAVEELRWDIDGDVLDLEFFLPRGSYATTFVREITKDEDTPPALRAVPVIG